MWGSVSRLIFTILTGMQYQTAVSFIVTDSQGNVIDATNITVGTAKWFVSEAVFSGRSNISLDN